MFLGPPGTGKTHLSIGLGIRAAQAGHRVAFATAAEWVARLGEAHTHGRLHAELARLGRIPLLVVDLCGLRDYVQARVRAPLRPVPPGHPAIESATHHNRQNNAQPQPLLREPSLH